MTWDDKAKMRQALESAMGALAVDEMGALQHWLETAQELLEEVK